ncbi:unnamed protein product [Symbiodinium natans]|uniref:Uncharacterized protein n=1 Tax=Symbiodinium natans TaxID=878477 RepID=A0A812GNN8_9DINO|nr:unnamed protein product [Symbiodinium natans]
MGSRLCKVRERGVFSLGLDIFTSESSTLPSALVKHEVGAGQRKAQWKAYSQNRLGKSHQQGFTVHSLMFESEHLSCLSCSHVCFLQGRACHTASIEEFRPPMSAIVERNAQCDTPRRPTSSKVQGEAFCADLNDSIQLWYLSLPTFKLPKSLTGNPTSMLPLIAMLRRVFRLHAAFMCTGPWPCQGSRKHMRQPVCARCGKGQSSASVGPSEAQALDLRTSERLRTFDA